MTKTTVLAAHCRVQTPLGPITLAATAAGLAGAWFDGQAHHPGEMRAPAEPAHPHLEQAARELMLYFTGLGRAGSVAPSWPGFTVPLDPQGTPFQQQVWQALRGIGPGRASSYGDIARQIGRPTAVRAVGAAIGRNPISVIVPCHRVLGRSGALTGYAGGLDRKRLLLQHEGRL